MDTLKNQSERGHDYYKKKGKKRTSASASGSSASASGSSASASGSSASASGSSASVSRPYSD